MILLCCIIDDQFSHIVKEEYSSQEGRDSKNGKRQNISEVVFDNDFDDLNMKIHESTAILKSLIPQILTEQTINTIYSRALINYATKPQQIPQQNAIPSPSQKIHEKNKLLILSFCNKGYGYEYLRSESSKINILEMEYDSNLFRIIGEGLKKLETFLISQRLISKKSSKMEMEEMYLKAIQYRNAIPPQICQILFNVLKGLYKVEPYCAVTKEQAFILYRTFKRIIQNPSNFPPQISPSLPPPKNKQFQNKPNKTRLPLYNEVKEQDLFSIKLQQGSKKSRDEKYELHKRWNSNYQQLLLQLYKRTPNISKIRDRFQLVFKNEADMFTVPALRSKLFKLLRVAIKLIFTLISKNGSKKLPPLIRLSDDRIKLIINSQQFRKVRLLILELYSKGSYDGPLLSETINQINLYVSQAQSNAGNRSVSNRSKKADSLFQYQQAPSFYHPKFQKGKRLKYNRQINPKGIIGQKFKKDSFIRTDDQDGNINLMPHFDNQSIYNIEE